MRAPPPVQKPGNSKQTYGTPWELVRAVERDIIRARFGLDLAASAENKKAPRFISEERDSLKQDWFALSHGQWCWLNPPFANIGKWAEKCHEESRLGCKIIMLVPASIGSEWFAEYCENECTVIALRPRLTFEGCADPYPKDCMLLNWTELNSFITWRWHQ